MMTQFGHKHVNDGSGKSYGKHGVLPMQADGDMNTMAEEHILQCAKNELDSGLWAGHLRLGYQPQIDMSNGQIKGVEAQLQWVHTEFGQVSNGALATLIGGTAMEKVVAEWAVREACMNIRAMVQRGLPVVHTTIRLSARQLMDPQLPEQVRESLTETGIQPELIELGIAESALLANHQALTPALRKLADTGVGIAIRDFGSDHSGLSYPKHFPVSAIWINCPFFWLVAKDGDAAEIISTILSLAKKLDLNVVAWGVECANQMMMLYDEGCNVMQGNFLCRPLQIDPFAALVRQLGIAPGQTSQGLLHA
jgi:EAL domain-containing protein (putative c-di-GMP-specific phosphodiesterase class I)